MRHWLQRASCSYPTGSGNRAARRALRFYMNVGCAMFETPNGSRFVPVLQHGATLFNTVAFNR